MRRIEIGFVARVKVLGILSTAQAGDGGIDKLNALLAVFKKVAFSEAELHDIEVIQVDDRTTRHRIKDPAKIESGFGGVSAELEQAEAMWLARQIRQWQANATIYDVEWLNPLLAALDAKPEAREPKVQFKRRQK